MDWLNKTYVYPGPLLMTIEEFMHDSKKHI